MLNGKYPQLTVDIVKPHDSRQEPNLRIDFQQDCDGQKAYPCRGISAKLGTNWGQNWPVLHLTPGWQIIMHILVHRKVDCVGSPKNPWMPRLPIFLEITQLSSMSFRLPSGDLT